MVVGFRSRLFLAFLALILGVGLVSAWYGERQFRGWMEQRIEAELEHRVLLARVALEQLEAGNGPAEIDALADALGAASGARVTVVLRDGTVGGDSELSVDRLSRIENHGQRPEIRAAGSSGQGTSRRHSTTLQTGMLYVAVPFDGAVGQGVVRIALPLVEVDELIARVRLRLAVAGLLGLVLAVVMSGLASHRMTRTLRSVVSSATAAAAGHGGPIRGVAPGELGGIAGSINHLSRELRNTVAELADERDRFHRVLDSMSEAVLTVDEDYRVTMANRAAREFLEAREEQLAGRPLFETLRIPALQEALSRSREKPVLSEFEFPAHPPRQVLIHVTPLRARPGHVLVFHDVTEMRKLETVRRDFVANVSHELRTPVSVILGNAETLLDGALDDRGGSVRFVDAIRRNAERLSRLISDLLDLSRIEAGRYALERSLLELDPVVRRALDAVGPASAARRQQIEFRGTAALSVVADSEALEQVLLNLLDNAVKYTPADGRIEVHAALRDGQVRIEVRDDGPGIEPRHRQRVFERFYRVDPGRSREMGGTGLGLAIVKHLVESMGGNVGVEPREPRGSVFWVELPASDLDRA